MNITVCHCAKTPRNRIFPTWSNLAVQAKVGADTVKQFTGVACCFRCMFAMPVDSYSPCCRTIGGACVPPCRVIYGGQLLASSSCWWSNAPAVCRRQLHALSLTEKYSLTVLMEPLPVHVYTVMLVLTSAARAGSGSNPFRGRMP